MILGEFRHVRWYGRVIPPLGDAIAWARSFDPQAEDGRYEIAGRDVYANVASYSTRPAGEIPFEAHREYIDVQILLAGAERLDVAPVEGLNVSQDYSAVKDVALYKAPERHSCLILRPGVFAVLWPHEAHRPGVAINGPEKVRKVVVKVRVAAV